MSKSAKKVIPTFPVSDFEKFMHDEIASGKTKEQVLNEVFNGDGFILFTESMEERVPKLESAQLFAPDKASSDVQECRRLRENFGPVSDCADYIKNQILAGGFDIFIDDPTDDNKKKIKKTLLDFMRSVYQDQYTTTLKILSEMMLDDAIVTGFSAAEIVYETPVTFEQYAKVEPVVLNVKDPTGKTTPSQMIQYKMELPKWDVLKSVQRLKILVNPYIKLKPYKNNDWTINYWTYGETIQQAASTETQMVQKSMGKLPSAPTSVQGTYLHPWQVFALSINRQKPQDIMGRSLILPVLSVSKILEKIMNAVGEGIHRAGNKKYFIVCGTEKRPWSAIHIRNLLQQLKEAGEKGWSTIPVPAGFDIKEAGGQVFEAQNVIDYFLRVIASTMHVPVRIVGIESRDPLPEQVTDDLLRYKEAFKTAIETQLFKLVIWTKFGDKKTKQGGSEEPIYLPEIRFRTEELMSDVNRLKMCKEILNVANPVRPETKLEVERDLCRIMGYDVLLPSQEEYKNQMEELDKQMKKQLAEKPAQPTGPVGQPKGLSNEKFQGPPKPQSEEQQKNRLEGGVNVKKQKVKG